MLIFNQANISVVGHEQFATDNYTYVNSAQEGDQLIRRPMHKINLGLLYTVNSALDFGLNLRWRF